MLNSLLGIVLAGSNAAHDQRAGLQLQDEAGLAALPE